MDTLSLENTHLKRPPYDHLDSEWWDLFLEKTAGLTKPALYKNILTGDERSRFKQAILKMIGSRTREDSSRIRLYIEGNLMNTGYLYNNFFPNLPKGQEDIQQWMRQTFGDVKFALLINNCGLMDEAIPAAVCRYLKPLLEKTGIPGNGLQIDLILGNYGYTPFGIHRDNIGDSIFHFHLGPGTKYMYTWEPGHYLNKLRGAQNQRDFEAFLPFAAKFEIDEGDIYYMPWTEYHVGYTPEISISITTTLQFGTKTKLISNILQQLSADLLTSAGNGHLRSEKTPTLPSEFERLNKELEHNPLWDQCSFLEALKLSYSRFMLRSGSNSGMHMTISSKEEHDLPERTGNWFDGKRISIREPFPIYWRAQQHGPVEIYARGHDLEAANETFIGSLIRKLNDGAIHSYSSLLQDTGGSKNEKQVLKLLNKLYQLNAIIVE